MNNTCTSTGVCGCKTGYTDDKCASCGPDYYFYESNCIGMTFVLYTINYICA